MASLVSDRPPATRRELSRHTIESLMAPIVGGLLVMLTLLMIQLQSFSKLFLVFSTAPLGLIVATGFLLVFNAPFGFTALLGLIALSGMIMRNTVILVDQIDEDMRSGFSQWEAIVESTIRRSRRSLPWSRCRAASFGARWRSP